MKTAGEILIPSFAMHRRLPLNFRENDRVYFQNELTRHCPHIRLIECSDVLLDAHKGVVIDGWRVCPESLVSPGLIPSYGLPYVLRTVVKPRRRLKGGPYLMIHTSYCEGYGHWLSDAIPRLFLVRDRLADYKLLLPSNYTQNFYRDSLLPFGYADGRSIHYEQSPRCRVDRLAFSPHAGPSFCNVKDEILQEIRLLYYSYFGIPTAAPTRRIYVSRAKVSRRFVKNEDEVLRVLSKNGFEVVHPQEYSFLEQLKLAAEAEIMIGLTGSGLNNMMFMQPGSKVLEFKMKGDYHNLHYFGFASGLELSYYYQICETIGKDRVDADFVVDIPVLEGTLAQMLTYPS